MQVSGKVVKLFVSQLGSSERLEQEQLLLDAKGIVSDKFYDKDMDRSILITAIDSYQLAEENGITMRYGLLGENILIDFNPYALAPGTQLQIGETVLIEISQPCTICNHLSVVDKKLPKLLKEDRGIFAKTIHPGTIASGDPITILHA